MNDQEWVILAKMIDRELGSIAKFADETLAPWEFGSAVDKPDALIPKDDDFTHIAAVLTCRKLIREAQAPPLEKLQRNIVHAATQVVDTFTLKDVTDADKLVAMQNLMSAVRAARVATGEED